VNTALVVVYALAAFLVGLIVRDFFPSYVREKAKNLATKEDIRDITREIESVKNDYAHQLELVRATLQSRGRVLEVRYENEFGILLELSELLVNLRDAASSLRPIADYTTPGETEEDRKRKRLRAYDDASHALYKFAEVRRPFFPDEIHKGIHELLRIARMEAVEYAYNRPEGEKFMEYWDNAQKNAEKIKDLSESALGTIRERTQVWELGTD